MENRAIFEKICNIIEKNRGQLEKPLTGATILQTDLGIDGFDAEEIMVEYFSVFDIDSSNYVFSDYFGEDNFNPIKTLKYLFNLVKLNPISIDHLVECARNRKWTSPN